MAYEQIIYEQLGPVLRIWHNRPDRCLIGIRLGPRK